jgi:hypothetical protein
MSSDESFIVALWMFLTADIKRFMFVILGIMILFMLVFGRR